MHKPQQLSVVLLAALALTTSGEGVALLAHQGHEGRAKHHHDLRGVITRVEADKNQFEIKTDPGHSVLCNVDEKSTLKRGNKKISLKDVRPGERARCHCVSLRGGRHYSQSLLLEAAKDKEKPQ